MAQRGRFARRRDAAVEAAIAHVTPDDVNRASIWLVVPVGMVRDPEADDGHAAARQHEVERTRRNADEEIGASGQSPQEPRERLVEIREQAAKPDDVLPEVFALHRNDDPIGSAPPQSGDKGARFASVSPVLAGRSYAGSRDDAEPRSF